MEDLGPNLLLNVLIIESSILKITLQEHNSTFRITRFMSWSRNSQLLLWMRSLFLWIFPEENMESFGCFHSNECRADMLTDRLNEAQWAWALLPPLNGLSWEFRLYFHKGGWMFQIDYNACELFVLEYAHTYTHPSTHTHARMHTHPPPPGRELLTRKWPHSTLDVTRMLFLKL